MTPYPVPHDAGHLYQAIATAPAAGAEWSYTLPADYYFRAKAICFLLTTDANVANRYAYIQFVHNAQLLCEVGPIAAQIASTASRYSFAPGITSYSLAAILHSRIALPFPFYLPEGTVIQSLCDGIQVGDQYSSIFLSFDVWPLPS